MNQPQINLQEYETNLELASAELGFLFNYHDDIKKIEYDENFFTNINAYFDKLANITKYLTQALESAHLNIVVSNMDGLIMNDQLHQRNFNQVMERINVLENEFMERTNNKNEHSYSSMYAGSKKTRKNRRHK